MENGRIYLLNKKMIAFTVIAIFILSAFAGISFFPVAADGDAEALGPINGGPRLSGEAELYEGDEPEISFL